ncbi:hypothetical protein RFI_16143, partial [Reticulomyxa filosa]
RAKEKLVNLEKERQKKKQKKEKQKTQGVPSGKKTKDKETEGQAYKTAFEVAVEAKLAFEEALKEAKGKLTTHVHERSTFVKTGGHLDSEKDTDATLRRISSMYQNNLEEARKIDEAKRKAALVQYNKLVLKPLPLDFHLGKHTPHSSTANLTPSSAAATHSPFDEALPDDIPFSAPPSVRPSAATLTANT